MKRKLETEENSKTAKHTKSPRRAESEKNLNVPQIPKGAFSALEFVNQLSKPETELTGLQKFCKACDLPKTDPSTYDVVKSYITISPDCSALFKCLGKGRHSPEELRIFFRCFINILLRTAGDLNETFSNVGRAVCTSLLEGQVQKLYHCLRLKRMNHVKMATLHLLSTMVMQSKDSARDVANHLDFSLNCFTDILKQQNKAKRLHNDHALRVQYTQFVLSFFIAGDCKTSQKILEMRGFMSGIFKGLKTDSASLIQLLLTTLQENVIKNIQISKTSKIRMLSAVLNDIADLFNWDGVMDVEEENGKSFVRQLTYDFLYHACCPFKYGINFKDVTLGTSEKCQNHVLLRFIAHLSNSTTDPLIRDLVVKVLDTCPDLLSRFLTESQLCFKPRLSQKWFSNCDLVKALYESQPPVAPAITQAAKCRPNSTTSGEKFDIDTLVKMTIPGIIPSVFNRNFIKQCLKNESWDVRQKTLQVMHLALQKSKSSFDFIADSKNWVKSCYSSSEICTFTEKLKDALTKGYLDFGIVITQWGEYSKQKDVETPGLRSLLLSTMCLFHETFQETVSQVNFDFTKLIFGIAQKESRKANNEFFTEDNETSLHILRLFLKAPQKYKWFKSVESGRSPFHQLLLILTRSNEQLQSVATEVLKNVLVTNDILLGNEMAEVDTWLRHLPMSKDFDQNTIINYINRICGMIVRQPNRYSSILRSADKGVQDISFHDRNYHPTVSENWWNSIPNVAIDCDTSGFTNSSGADSNETSANTDSGQFQAMSLFMIAALDNLHFKEEDSAKIFGVLDGYLSSVVIDTFHSLPYTSLATTFAALLMCALAKVPDCEKRLPALFNFSKFASLWSENPSGSYKTISDKVPENIQTSLQVWFWNHFRGESKKASSLKSTGFFDKIKKMVCHDKSLNNEFDTSHVVSITFSQLLLYFDKLVHELEQESRIDKCASLATDLLNAISYILTLAYSSCVSTEDGGKECSQMNLYVKLAEQFLKHQSVQKLFLKENDLTSQYHSLTSSPDQYMIFESKWSLSDVCSSVIIEVIKNYKNLNSKSNSLPSISYYFSQVTQSVLIILKKLIANAGYKISKKDSILTIAALSHLHSLMSLSNLASVLNDIATLLAEIPTKSCGATFGKILCECLGDFLLKYEAPGHGKRYLTNSTVQSLFNYLGSKYSKSNQEELLSNITKLVHLQPFFATLAPLEIIEFCYRQVEALETIPLLHSLLVRNSKAMVHMSVLLTRKDGDLPKLCSWNEQTQLKLIPVVNWWLYHASILFKKTHKEESDDEKSLRLLKEEIQWVYERLVFNPQKFADILARQDGKSFVKKIFFEYADKNDLNAVTELITNMSAESGQNWSFEAKLFLLQVNLEMNELQNTKEAEGLKASMISMCMTFVVELLSSKKMSKDASLFFQVFHVINDLSLDDLKCKGFLHHEISHLWDKFIKLTFKYRFDSSLVLKTIIKLLPIMYHGYEDQEQILEEHQSSFMDAASLKELLTSHSKFLPILMGKIKEESEEEKITSKNNYLKQSLTELYYEICARCENSQLSSQDLGFLLSAYECTLSASDQNILKTVLLFEQCGVAMDDFRPYLWGKNAMTSYHARKNLGETLWKKPNPNELLSCIEADIMDATLSRFPLRRRMICASNNLDQLEYFENDPKPAISATENKILNHTCHSQRVYDPCYLLPAIWNLMSPDHLVDCRLFLQSGALSFLMACLASHCQQIRSLAATCITAFYQHAESAWFSEKNLTLYLISCVRKGICLKDEETSIPSIARVPSVVANFLGTLLKLHQKPADHMFSVLHRFLLIKPKLDLKNIPEFFVLFFSAEMEYKTERSWILNLMAEGLRDMGDFHVIRKRNAFQHMMCFHDSPLSDNHTRRQVLQILEQACSIRLAAFHLIKDNGFLAWLTEVVSQQCVFTAEESMQMEIAATNPIKRQNSTLHIIKVVKALWNTVNFTDFTASSETEKHKVPSQSRDSSQYEKEEDKMETNESDPSASEEETDTKESGVERDNTEKKVQKRAALAPFRCVKGLISISIGILESLLHINNVNCSTEMTTVNAAEISTDTIPAFHDIVNVLASCLANLQERRKQSRWKSNQEPQTQECPTLMEDACDINSEDAEILLRSAVFLNGAGICDLTSLLANILTIWTPPPTKNPGDRIQEKTALLAVRCIKWILDQLDTLFKTRNWFESHFVNLCKWIEQWLSVTDQTVDQDYQTLPVFCFNNYCKHVEYDTDSSEKLGTGLKILKKCKTRFSSTRL